MHKLGQRARGGFRSSTGKAGEASEHGVCLLEPDIGKVTAVTGVPAERRSAKLRGLIDQEEDELERVRQAYEVELGRRREGDRGVTSVERAEEANIG